MSFRERINHYALSKQIMIMLTASLMILMIVVLFVISIIINHSKATSRQLIDNSLRLMGATIEYNINNMRSIIDYIALQPDLNNFLKEDAPEEKYSYYTQMNSTLKGALSLNRNIIDIFVFDTDSNQIYANSGTAALNLPSLESIVEDSMTFLPEENILIMTQPISNPLEDSIKNHMNGYLVALLDPAFLTASSNDIPANIDMYLLSGKGNIIWQSTEDLEGDSITVSLPGDITLGIILNSFAVSSIAPSSIIAISIAIICGLVMIFLIWLSGTRSIVSPIQKFTAMIRSMKNEHAKAARLSAAYPEMRTLENEFIRLAERSEKLTNELIAANAKLYQQNILKTEAELKYLRSQINPHFLYNTLDSLTGLAAEHGDKEIIRFSKSLASIFRYSLRGEDMVPLANELKMIDNYLLIQRMRFGTRLNVSSDIKEETMCILIPKMILQPIAENAIIHGIENTGKCCNVLISAYLSGMNLILTISNDGTPIPPEELLSIQERLSMPVADSIDTRNRIGLVNVNARLRLSFGDEYGLKIESSEHMTSVTLRIPITEQGNEHGR